MVATLLRLRFRVLANTLRRSTWQLVASIFGAVYALGLLVGAIAGLVALGIFGDEQVIATVLVLGGSALIVGWIVLPLVMAGIDQTLDPARLAQYPIPRRTLLVGLTVTGLLGVPGIVTALAALATAAAWSRNPMAAAAAVVGAAIGVMIAVVGSRAVTAASVSFQSRRRVREFSGVIVLIPLFLLGPIILGLTTVVGDIASSLPAIAGGLGWTPIGAPWAISVAVAAGDWLGAGARVLIGLATIALLYLVWAPALARALETPVDPSAGAAGARRGLGLFGVVPETPAGAVMARSLTYWRRDPRYLRQLIFIPLLPLLLWFYSLLNESNAFLAWSGPVVGFALALTLASDISFDGTAFATHLADGVRGRDDRLGRVAALAIFAVPSVIIVTVVTLALTGRWEWLPGMLGVGLGVLLTGMGVCSISSARYVIPVPQAGDNPFKAAQGANFTTGLQSMAVTGIVALLTIPATVLAVVSLITGDILFGWIALVVGVVLGAVLLVVGLRAGGALLDRTGPSLLVSLRGFKNA